MMRRTFLKALAALPFVGRLVKAHHCIGRGPKEVVEQVVIGQETEITFGISGDDPLPIVRWINQAYKIKNVRDLITDEISCEVHFNPGEIDIPEL